MDVSTVWGFVSYKVFNPVTGVVYKLSADAAEAESRQVNASEYFLRYVAMLSKTKSETSEGILSKLSSGIIPLPHQLHVLNRAEATIMFVTYLQTKSVSEKQSKPGLLSKS